MWIITKIHRFLFLSLIASVLFVLAVQPSAYAANGMNLLETRPSILSSKAVSALLTDVEVVGQKAVAVGDRGHILISSDNGASWQQAQVPVQLLLTAVDFSSALNGWAVGHEGLILNTNDGGLNWNIQYANPHRQLSDEELGQLSDDEFAKLPQAGSPLLDVWFKDDKIGFAVGAYGMFLCTDNGGESWLDCADRIENYDGWHLNAIMANSDGVVYIAGEKGVLFRSSDYGETWETIASPYAGSFFGILIGPEVSDVFVFGLQGNVYRSTNTGESWEKITGKVKDGVMGGLVFNKNHVTLVGNSGVIMNSKDSGKTFTTKITKERQAILAIDQLPTGDLVMVGQGGVTVVKPE